MGDIHDDLREVMGLLGNIVPTQKPLPDLLLATYHEARGWNACREAMLALIRQHGPALLASQEGEDRLRDLHRAIRLVYGCVPDLPIDESTMDAATDALHNFCLMVGIHEVDVDSPIDEAARSGGGG